MSSSKAHSPLVPDEEDMSDLDDDKDDEAASSSEVEDNENACYLKVDEACYLGKNNVNGSWLDRCKAAKPWENRMMEQQAANREPFEVQSLKNSKDLHGACSKLSDSSSKISEAYLIKVKKIKIFAIIFFFLHINPNICYNYLSIKKDRRYLWKQAKLHEYDGINQGKVEELT
ncbi:hypothetical protein IEQ34_021611 [Dendrobium chrysotoxum]|uniref:Uncharacterized protein n=1 Tax=Dendrobium chrysotoxum TaxID=161865 RepID=A0AAV7G5M3_DENCH|nr:hypothetical protein IEQ34_021611 [Dendrobium chrysotoxum]